MKTYSFEHYSSKIKRINIPLPTFSYIHKSWFSKQIDGSSPGYIIGRDRIIEKLKTWLTKEKANSGVYLITGYRGMGKTSFVNRVLFELVGEADLKINLIGLITFLLIFVSIYQFHKNPTCEYSLLCLCTLFLWITCRYYVIKEKIKKIKFYWHVAQRYIRGNGKARFGILSKIWVASKIWGETEPKEWERINNLVYGSNVTQKKYSHICININLGQEILDERSILCVLTTQLYNKYRNYILSPIANVEFWYIYSLSILLLYNTFIEQRSCENIISVLSELNKIFKFLCFSILLGFVFFYHQIRIIFQLRKLTKRIDAYYYQSSGGEIGFSKGESKGKVFSKHSYQYLIANTRDIESQLIDILDRIERFPIHPTFYFVFDELDKIETPLEKRDSFPEYSNERYLTSGGTSRKRKFTVMHLLANMKYFTSTAKARFIFIAGREMYDGFLADLTDRESAISSLFNGVIYVESFCKNEKSERDVMYNTETFISRQLLPQKYIEEKVIDKLIECKQKEISYSNIDINLKVYYEYLISVYSYTILHTKGMNLESQKEILNNARIYIDKIIVFLYHFAAYMYHVSNGSPKKMRLTFENYVRPLKDSEEFRLSPQNLNKSPLEILDVDIHIPTTCQYLLSFSEKEQRVIGFIHYISYPVNQIITDADQFGDKLLVSASYLINHIYKYHTGGFSWRNIEQTPELLEVYKIPEFRSFINYILNYLTQTHIIQIPCGLFQYKFRKQIAEEISLASKISEDVSAIFNFTLDESQTVKQHYYELLKSHIRIQKDEKIFSPHSLAGIHHILADLHMADEDYNNAIFEYQMALRILDNEYRHHKDNPKQASYTLAYIRLMLKLGLSFEKRRTMSSAYNIYGEIVDKLFLFRELDEKKFGLDFNIEQDPNWPNYNAILYTSEKQDNRAFSEKVMPEISVSPSEPISYKNYNHPYLYSDNERNDLIYKIEGNDFISDFSHHLTPLKHAAIQNLSMIEDTQTIYQALLAKLFINEKIELGGITRTNLDIIEEEFQYIHRTTNSREKFLISTDFFRRLGDIMFYKNGLIGFSFYKKDTNGEVEEPYIDSLYFWAFDIKKELHDFCRKYKCYESYQLMLNYIRTLSEEQIMPGPKRYRVNSHITNNYDVHKALVYKFLEEKIIIEKLEKIPQNEVRECNCYRKYKWGKNQTMPCYACKYYNRSLRIMMKNLFDINIEREKLHRGSTSKTIVILKQLIIGGSAKSMRSNHMIQLGEVLDCLGNTMLSCANISPVTTIEDSHKRDIISSKFLAIFLHDVNEMNKNVDREKNIKDFLLPDTSDLLLGKLEICILYYWEASICFRYGQEQKKAACSIKKILRILQNYLRVSSLLDESYLQKGDEKVIIGEFLNEIKNQLVRQGLLYLYSHYNFINIVEIQRLKWIFYTQMYENISLNRLSLFPDVEEIMLIYYEMIQLCMVHDKDNPNLQITFNETRKNILNYSREKKFEMSFSWDNIQERNNDFENRLCGIYNSMSMGCLRHSNTIYEYILSLKFKTMLNRYILELAFPQMKQIKEGIREDTFGYVQILCENLIPPISDTSSNDERWMRYFPSVFTTNNNPQSSTVKKIFLLEFLIKDSLFCLTYILENITPYTSTTLFTNSFMGDIYKSLNQWTILFEAVFKFYKIFDSNRTIAMNNEEKRFNNIFSKCDDISGNQSQHCCKCDSKVSPRYIEKKQENLNYSIEDVRKEWLSKCSKYSKAQCKYKPIGYKKEKKIIIDFLNKQHISLEDAALEYRSIHNCNNISDRFFEEVLLTIKKPNIHFTLPNYSGEQALSSYRKAKQVHREGKSYKEMISKMYYLDDDLKNDTIQFDIAIERFKINSEYVDRNIDLMLKYVTDPIYDIENFCLENETIAKLEGRFTDLSWKKAHH